jgi:hypothetical protein
MDVTALNRWWKEDTLMLSADDLREIDRAAAEIEVSGARYPEHLQRMVGR